MRIALGALFMEADLLEQRIRESVPEEVFEIEEYNQVETILSQPNLFLYDAIWIAFPGAAGLEAVMQVREQSPNMAIVWISSDEDSVWLVVKYCISMFLFPDSPPSQYRIAVQNCRRSRY